MNRRLILLIALIVAMLAVNTLPAAAQSADQTIGVDILYTVQYGDTLAKIAAKFGTTWQALAQLNGITNPNLIYVGQTIKIRSGTPPTSKYVVQPGDTLVKIAARFGMTVADLAKLNNITDINKIYVGQVLLVTGVITTPPTTYVVQYGDTLYKISVRFGIPMSKLVQLNNIVDVNRIYVGQVLKLA
jgi:peptidoglycan-N-acetylglucosamine deacetylase